MTVTYQVGGGGHLDIDFWVRGLVRLQIPVCSYRPQLADPDHNALGKHLKQSTGTVSITAKKDGRHEYCFSNQMSSVVDKLVRYVKSYDCLTGNAS